MPGKDRFSLAAEKAALRSFGRDARERQPFFLRSWRSRRIVGKIMGLSAYRRARTIFAYFPVCGEVDVRPLIRNALGSGKAVALPRVAGKRNLEFYRIKGLQELAAGAFGIPEPAPVPPHRAPASKADLILVPGLAFSFDGHRLGFGGGFYDALLPGRRGVALGVGFELQLRGRIPSGPRDARLDGLVTEKRVLFVRDNR